MSAESNTAVATVHREEPSIESLFARMPRIEAKPRTMPAKDGVLRVSHHLPGKPLWMAWAENFIWGVGHSKARPRPLSPTGLGHHAGTDYERDAEYEMWLPDSRGDLFLARFLAFLAFRRQQDEELGPDYWPPLPKVDELTPAFLEAVLRHARHLGTLSLEDVALVPDLEVVSFHDRTTPARWLARLDGAPVLPAEAIGVFYGKRSSFKSYVAVELTAAIACGRRELACLTLDYPEGAWAVYIGAEDAMGLARRLKSACERYSAEDPRYRLVQGRVVLTDMNSTRDLIRRVKLTLRPAAQVGLIVIDTYNQARAPGDDENSADSAGRFTTGMKLLSRAFPGSTVAAIHHENKQGEMRGALAFGDNVDFLFRFERDAKAARTTLTCGKVRNAEEAAPFDLVFANSDSGLVLAQAEAGATGASKPRSAKDPLFDHEQKTLVFRALARAEPAGFTYSEWKAEASSAGTFSAAKALMEDREFVTQSAGRYRLTASGRAQAATRGWLKDIV